MLQKKTTGNIVNKMAFIKEARDVTSEALNKINNKDLNEYIARIVKGTKAFQDIATKKYCKEEDDICENKIRREENNVSTDYFYLFNGIEITGLLFAILSIFLPFVKVGLLGISRTITLLEGDGIIIAGISVVVIIF